MTPEQCRMARSALKWSLDDLTAASGLGRATLARLELGQTVSADTIAKARASLEAAGIHFIDKGQFAGGVQRRLRPMGSP